MKKLLYILSLAALVLTACNPNNNDPEKDNPGPSSDYVAPINIDGSFDDWAKLDASKVTTITCAASASKKDLKLAKIYADKYFVFFYVEFDFSAYDNDVQDGHFHFYINGDNDTSTGGYKGAFNQGETPCVDVMTEGDVIEAGSVCPYDATAHTWEGPVNDPEWNDDYWIPQEVYNFIDGMGTKKAYEFRLVRELYPAGKLAKKFTMGMDICVNGWDATGALPNAESSEANPYGEAPLLEVTY